MDYIEYPIIIANLSATHMSNRFLCYYKRSDGSCGYLVKDLVEASSIIKFSDDNESKVVFKKKEHLFKDPTYELDSIVISSYMFNT